MSPKPSVLRRLAVKIVLPGLVTLSLMSAVSGAESVSIDGENSPRGPTSLVLDSAGNPRIIYYHGALKFAACSDPRCRTPPTLRTLDGKGMAGQFNSMVLDSAGNPRISFSNPFDGGVRFVLCTDPSCGGFALQSLVDNESVWLANSLVLDAGNRPRVGYRQVGALMIAICTDSACSSPPLTRLLDNQCVVGASNSMVLNSAGNPVLSYYDSTNNRLKLAVCPDSTCSGTPTIRFLNPAGGGGTWPSMALDSAGNPRIGFMDGNNNDLKLAVCSDSTCSTTPTIRTLDSVGDAGNDISLVLNSAGNPLISYYDETNDRLKLAICSDPTCSAAPIIRNLNAVGEGGEGSSLVLDSAGNPRISYSDEDAYSVKLLICDDPGCVASSSHIVFAHGFEN